MEKKEQMQMQTPAGRVSQQKTTGGVVMLKERVATIECLTSKTAKTIYYLNRYDADSWLYGFWLYTIEDEQGQTLQTFEIEPAEPDVHTSNAKATEVEKYLEEFKYKAFSIPLILYEVEYLHKDELDKQIGFKSLREWYEEFLRYVDNEVLKLLSEDFVKGFWEVYKVFYRNNEDFRKLLSIERYYLSNMFSSVLMYMKDVISNGKPKDYVVMLYGEEFAGWLVSVVNKFYNCV